jgi:hypothetical protein
MRADEEIRQDTRSRPTGPAIPREGLSGKKQRRPRKRRDDQSRLVDERVQFLDALIADRKFGINDIVDQQGPARLAASSCSIDQSAQVPSLVTRSSRTFVSMSVTRHHG